MSITLLTAMSESPPHFDVFIGMGCRLSYRAAERAVLVAESYAGEVRAGDQGHGRFM